MGICKKNNQIFNTSPSAPKDQSGKVKNFLEWTLGNLIDVSCSIGFLTLHIKKFSHALRDFRNYIHPYEQIKNKFNPDNHTANICLQVLTNALLVISDGIEARAGSLTADKERFMPWRTIDGTSIAPKGKAELETLLKGMFRHDVFLDMIRNFIVFEVDAESTTKKIAAYHQYHAVNKAVECTIDASSLPDGDKRAGVIWHTQGSGKSLSMAFYAGKIILDNAMLNPTLVVLTDRNDLDDQLFDTFSKSKGNSSDTPFL